MLKESFSDRISRVAATAADRMMPRRKELLQYPARRVIDVAVRGLFFGSDFHLQNATQIHVYRDTVVGGLIYDQRPPSALNHGVPNRYTLPHNSTLEIKPAADEDYPLPNPNHDNSQPALPDSGARTRRIHLDDYAQMRLQQAERDTTQPLQKAALRAGQVLTDIGYLPQAVFGTADHNTLALVADGYTQEAAEASIDLLHLSTTLSQYEMPRPGRQLSPAELASQYTNNILLIATIMEMEMSADHPHTLGEVAGISLPTIYLTALEAAHNGTQLETLDTFQPELYAAAMTGQFLCVLSDVMDQNRRPTGATETTFNQLFAVLRTVNMMSRQENSDTFYESIGYALGAYMRHAADSFASTGDDITFHAPQIGTQPLREIVLRPGDMAQLLVSPLAAPYIPRKHQTSIKQGYYLAYGGPEAGFTPEIRSYSNLYEEILASHSSPPVE